MAEKTSMYLSLDQAAIRDFETRLSGPLIKPSDAEYDQARRVWNGMIDRYPALIARCTGVSDVIAAVNFAREQNLLVAVRGGGHNVAGTATCDGGLVIDLSPMKGIQVDPGARTARAQAGVIWGELDRETQRFGLATPGGEVSETGIAGLTLSGGMGYLRRKHGLSCDNLISADVVTADGRFLKASADENPDLFWGLRGGGGNFGIVTSFEYRLHPLGPEVMAASVLYPYEQAETVMRAWREFTADTPDEVSSACILWSVPATPDFPEAWHNQPVIIVEGMYAGTVEYGQRVLQPLREFGTPLVDLSGPTLFTTLQSEFDVFAPAGNLYYWKSINLDALTDDLVDLTLHVGLERPSPQSLIVIRHLGGAMNRVGAAETAFGERSALYNLSLDTGWTDPADTANNIAWTRAVWDQASQHTSKGVYLNFPGFLEEGDALLQRAYGENYDRLVALKTKYDPDNLFRLHQNIKPLQEHSR
jgi:FAD/FMN-containing dehydrogenase